jgi:hypothetical protein
MPGIWLGEAIDVLYPAVMDWVHHPSGSSKRALFEAYEGLTPRAKTAYDADVSNAFRREHGASTVVYRYKTRGDIGGASVSPVEPKYLDPSQYKKYQIEPSDVLVHYAQSEMPLGGKAFGHEKEIILRASARPVEVKTAYCYDFRKVARPIKINKDTIAHAVEADLVPELKRWLKRQPQDEPVGKQDVIADSIFYIEAVDGETLKIQVAVVGKPSNGDWASVLGGGVTKRTFKDGVGTVTIILWLNGAITPAEYLRKRFEPLSACRYETCVPYGLYSILIHEVTHAAEVSFGGRATYKVKNDELQDDVAYVNDPKEVRAFIQQIVDEVVGNSKHLKSHFQGRKLVDMLLRMSTTWTLIEKDLRANSKKLILTAVYQALQDEGLLG